MRNTKKITRIYTFELQKLIIGGNLIKKSELVIFYAKAAAPPPRLLENKNHDDIYTSHHRITRNNIWTKIYTRQVVSR